jgi:type I restriction enzyme S subunit
MATFQAHTAIGNVPQSWPVRTLASFATKIGSGATPRGGAAAYLAARVSHALIRSQHVFDRHFDSRGLAYISPEQARELRNSEVQTHDILLNITGDGVTFGRACMAPNEELPACVNQHVAIVRVNQQECIPSYLLSVLTHPNAKTYMESFNTGGSRRALTKGHIESFRIPLPPLAVQAHIGGILAAYDDLIENCDRRIRVLDEMARALYREWFVLFRYPGHQKTPLVDLALGRIPKGWELGRLDDIVVLQRGFDLPKDQREDGTVPIIAATGINGFHSTAKVRAPGVVTGRSGSIGKVLYVQEDFWPLNTALWGKEFPKAEPLFAYFVLSNIELAKFNSGAAVPTLNRNDVHGLEAVIPPRQLQRLFQEYAESFIRQVSVLERRVENLRRTRDLLLPRLLSGQVSVEDAA